MDETGCGIKHVASYLVASTIHRGPYHGIAQVHAELAAWIRANGYTSIGPPEEVYCSEPTTPPDETVTEIRVPVARG